VRQLGRVLDRTELDSPVPRFELLKGQLKTARYEAAEETARGLVAKHPNLHAARELLGVAQIARSRTDDALRSLERSLAERETPEAHYNYGLAALQGGKLELSAEHLGMAIGLRPNLFRAWVYLGRIEAMRGNLEAARKALVRSLEIEPSYGPAYEELIEVLRRMGAPEEADRYLDMGLRVALDPSRLKALVEGSR